MDSPNPAIEAQEFLADARWPAFRSRLLTRRAVVYGRLTSHELDHAAMCRLTGELRGLDYALGSPVEMLKLDPRSDNA